MGRRRNDGFHNRRVAFNVAMARNMAFLAKVNIKFPPSHVSHLTSHYFSL